MPIFSVSITQRRIMNTLNSADKNSREIITSLAFHYGFNSEEAYRFLQDRYIEKTNPTFGNNKFPQTPPPSPPWTSPRAPPQLIKQIACASWKVEPLLSINNNYNSTFDLENQMVDLYN